MFRTLYAKLALILLALFGFSAVLVLAVSLDTTELYQQEVNQKLNKDIAKHIVGELPLMQNGEINQSAMEQLFHQLMVFNPSIEIYLLDTTGKILGYSAPPGKVKRESVNLKPINDFLSGKMAFPFKGDDPRDFNKQKVFTVDTINVDNEQQGYLYVILGSEEYDHVIEKLQRSYILNIGTWTIILVLLFSLAAGLLLFAWITGKLRRLSSAMTLFKQGKPTSEILDIIKLKSTPRDEIDLLNNTFIDMSEQINSQLEQLKNTDRLRRDLIANVSHDLRTPLATLQGYIETLMLKDATLSTEDRKEYLEIAIEHCNRLNKLVKELFELAKLDAKETKIKAEPFNLMELLQDVIQKFRLSAKQKNISLDVNFTHDLPLVHADIGLIERVFENLLENAMRFTDEGGKISIGIESHERQIEVLVQDTGCGIAAEELPYIFERFYQTDKNRNAQTDSSGLGLSISKRILDLHGSNIQVESAVNSGTTFRFALPVYYAA